jgi:hypothetical protein
MNHRVENHIRVKNYCFLGNDAKYYGRYSRAVHGYVDPPFSGWSFETSVSSETSKRLHDDVFAWMHLGVSLQTLAQQVSQRDSSGGCLEY